MFVVLFFILSLHASDVLAVRGRGGARKRSHNDDGIVPHVADIDPASRTRDQWELLSVEALRLACNDAHLATGGTRPALIDRLLVFYSFVICYCLFTTAGLPVSTTVSSSSSPGVSGPGVSVSGPAMSTNVSNNQSRPSVVNGNAVPTLSIDISALVTQEVRRCLQQQNNINNNIPNTNINQH